MTHTEKIAAVYGGLFLLACFVTWLFHYLVLAVWWWPLVGSEWRGERQWRHQRVAAARADGFLPPDLGERFLAVATSYSSDLPSPAEEADRMSPDQAALVSSRAGEPDWDEPSSDADADEMIATWRGEGPTYARSAGLHGSDRATSHWDASSAPYASGEEHEQLADVHPIYLDLSEDPDLIVWDAKQQADRCWKIVHIEFPRLRAELASMWEAAA